VWLTHFERILTKAGGNYFVGNTFSIADLNGFDVLETVYELEPTLFNNYPQLTGFLKRVASRPAIAAYRASGYVQAPRSVVFTASVRVCSIFFFCCVRIVSSSSGSRVWHGRSMEQ
jgi:hypothetical protein